MLSHTNSTKNDFVDFLISDFRERPAMYLGDYSISKFPALMAGFMIACHYYDEAKTGMDRLDQFYEWFNQRHALPLSSSWTHPFLEMTNHDEKAALSLFLSELELFVRETHQNSKSESST